MENYRVFREKRDYELLFPEDPKQQISEDWRDETMSSPIMSKIAEHHLHRCAVILTEISGFDPCEHIVFCS